MSTFVSVAHVFIYLSSTLVAHNPVKALYFEKDYLKAYTNKTYNKKERRNNRRGLFREVEQSIGS